MSDALDTDRARPGRGAVRRRRVDHRLGRQHRRLRVRGRAGRVADPRRQPGLGRAAALVARHRAGLTRHGRGRRRRARHRARGAGPALLASGGLRGRGPGRAPGTTDAAARPRARHHDVDRRLARGRAPAHVTRDDERPGATADRGRVHRHRRHHRRVLPTRHPGDRQRAHRPGAVRTVRADDPGQPSARHGRRVVRPGHHAHAGRRRRLLVGGRVPADARPGGAKAHARARFLAVANRNFSFSVPGTVGGSTWPAMHTQGVSCGALVQSDGTRYLVVEPYACGDPIVRAPTTTKKTKQ